MIIVILPVLVITSVSLMGEHFSNNGVLTVGGGEGCDKLYLIQIQGQWCLTVSMYKDLPSPPGKLMRSTKSTSPIHLL